MVTFICYHCNKTMKKQQVGVHAYKCRTPLKLICIDCKKTFNGTDHEAHTNCLTEKQMTWGQYANKKPVDVQKEEQEKRFLQSIGKDDEVQDNGTSKTDSPIKKFPGWKKSISNAIKIQTKNQIKFEKIKKQVVKEYLDANPEADQEDGDKLFDKKVAEGKTYEIINVQYLRKIKQGE